MSASKKLLPDVPGIFDLVGGPFEGGSVRLDDSPTTCIFRWRHWHGRYAWSPQKRAMVWESVRSAAKRIIKNREARP